MAGEDITYLLQNLEAGERQAFDRLLARVYDELRVIARAKLRNERDDHTLSTTGLVHEAYLKLVDHKKMNWQNRAHFFGAAAQAMRRHLVDYARAKATHKRNGQKVGLTEAGPLAEVSMEQLLELDDALERMNRINPRWVQVVECRFFAGLTLNETAAALGISQPTVSSDWRLARAWLRRELGSF